MGMVFKTSIREDQISSSVESAEQQHHRQTLEAAIDKETSTRESVDAAIKADVEQLFNNLSDEIVLRAQDDLNVKNELQAAIDSETAIRSAQNSQLQRNIDAEGSARVAADNAIRQDYISADSALLDQINNDYNPKIAALNTALHNEQTLSANRHATLASDLTASINAEKSARSTADSNLQNSLASEISTRKSQTDALDAAVTKEIADRTSAVNNLQSNLSTAIGNEASTRASAVNELKSSITSAVNNISANIKDFTPSTTTKDGTAGFVPAPPKKKSEDEILVLTSDGFQTLAESNIFIGAIPSQNGEPQYTGSAISPQWINFDENKMSIGGTTSATNAGTYIATFTPKGLYCWSDGTRTAKSVPWRIVPKIVQVPTAAVTQFEYTGNTITLSVTNPNSDCVNSSGATWAVNAGNYTATYKLKSTTNYIFSDGTTTDKSINWKINAKKLAKPTASVTAFTYNKSAQGLTISNYDSNYMTKSGSDTATAAASYSVTFALKNTTNTTWSDGTTANVKIDWSIDVLKLTKPSASTTAFTYDGVSKNLSVSNFNSNYESLSGSTSEINAGSYSATYSLLDTTNTTWSDGSTANVVINWSIARQKLSAALSTFSQSGTLTYNGSAQSPTISGYNASYHDLSSTTSATNAGTYTAKVTPKSNYAFSDGSTAAKSFSWSIGVYKLDKPTAAKTEFEYTGATFTLDISNYNANYMNRTGTYSASAEGDYSVTFTLKDTSNFCWKDNSTAAVVINWKIKTNKLTKPTISAGASLEYTGGTLKPTIENYNSNYMTQSGTASAVNVGSYSITYALKDKTNTTWADGSTSDITLTWQITRKKLTAAQSTFSQSGTLTYTGNAQTVSISGYNASYHDLSSTTSATNAGTYTAKVTPKSNYAFSDGSTSAKSVSWSIGAKSLTKPTAATTSFEYDGAVKTLSISNYNSSYMTKSGTDSASVKGNYEVTFTLNDTSNLKWADNTTSTVKIPWSIGSKSIAKPTISGDTTFTYDGNAKTLNVTGYDSDTMILSGTISATNAGDYTATFTLRDKSNTCWVGGSTDDLKFSWKINRAKLSAELSTGFAQSGTLTFNGQEQIPTITNFDSRYHVLGGTTSAKWAGTFTWSLTGLSIATYTATVTPKSNYSWNDGSFTSKNVSWRINPIIIPYPVVSNTSLEYNGETQRPTIETNLDYVQIYSGSLTATNVNKYNVSLIPYPYLRAGTSTNLNLTYAGVAWEGGGENERFCKINWEITAKKITKPTMPTTSYTYTGNTISPTVNNFDSTWIEKTGTDSAVNVGTYSVTYALKDKTNTTWSDGSTDDIVLTWTINKRTFTIPYLENTSPLIYNKYYQHPKLIGITYNGNSYVNFIGPENGCGAGTYTWTYALKDKTNTTWADGSTDDIVLTWTIEKLTLTKPTLTNTSYTYDGTAHSPTINDYNSSYESQTGTASSTNAGNFTLTYALKDKTNTTWADGSTDDIVLSWVINKATPTLTLSTDTLTFDATGTKTVTVTYTGDGSLSASSNDSDIVASISNKVITVKANFIAKNSTVIVSATQTTNYKAVSKNVSVSCIYEVSFADCTWAQIQKVAKLGLGYEIFGDSVGTYKTITNSSLDLKAVGIFDDDTKKEWSFPWLSFRLIDTPKNKNYIVCRIEPTLEPDNFAIVFSDDKPTTDTSNYGFCYNRFGTICQSFYNALPTEIKNVMVNAYGHFKELNSSSWVNTGMSYNFFLPGLTDIVSASSLNTVLRTNGFAYPSESAPTDCQMEYYANGNIKWLYYQKSDGTKGSHSEPRFLLRDKPDSDSVIQASGDVSSAQFVKRTRTYPGDIAPCFCIG